MCILLSKSYRSQPWQRCLSNFCFYSSSRPSSGRTITLMVYVLEPEDEISFRLTSTVVFLRTWLWFYDLEGKWWAQQQHIVSSGSAEFTHLIPPLVSVLEPETFSTKCYFPYDIYIVLCRKKSITIWSTGDSTDHWGDHECQPGLLALCFNVTLWASDSSCVKWINRTIWLHQANVLWV